MNFVGMSSSYWDVALFSLFSALFFVFLALKLFPKWGLMDRPHRYGLKRKPIPYYGGLAIYAAFVLSVFLFVPIGPEMIGVLFGSGLLVILGFLDDMFSISPWLRLFFQFLAGVILVFAGVGILSFNFPFLGVVDFSKIVVFGIPLLGALFSIFWVMTILNTMNFIDGVSGLNSGVTFIAGFTIFFLSIHPGIHEDPSSQVAVATLALIVAMIALAFFFFERPKARILMGDTGSTFFGFMLAVLAIFSGGKVATAFIVLGIPILDMIWVVLRRTLSGRKFWQGDLMHLHHRLLKLDIDEGRVVAMYLFVTAIFGFLAITFVSSQQKFFTIMSLIVLMLLLAGALVFIPKKR